MPRNCFISREAQNLCLNLKPFKNYFLNIICRQDSEVDTYEADTAADSIIWEVFVTILADIHKSSQLIH